MQYPRHYSALFFLFSASFMVCSVYSGINDEWSDEEFAWDWEEELAIAQEAPRSAERPRVTQLEAEEKKEIRKYAPPQKEEPKIAPPKEKSVSTREAYKKKRAERMRAAKAQPPSKKHH